MAALGGGVLWIPYGIFEMLELWGVDAAFDAVCNYDVVLDAAVPPLQLAGRSRWCCLRPRLGGRAQADCRTGGCIDRGLDLQRPRAPVPERIGARVPLMS